MSTDTTDDPAPNGTTIDPTSWQDYIALIFILICTLNLIVIELILLIRKKSYEPLKTKNITMLSLMITGGLIHMWSSLISNDHFNMFIPIQENLCVFWSYWMQYFLGLNSWFVFFTLRTLSIGFVFHPVMSKLEVNMRTTIKILAISILTGPLLSTCIAITSTNGSYFNEDIRSCESILKYKAAIFICIVFEIWILISISIYIKPNRIKSRFFNEYYVIFQIVLIGIVCIVINGWIIFLGFLKYSYGRSLFTILVSFIYTFSITRLVGYSAYKALTKNKKYEQLYYVEIRDIKPMEIDFNGLWTIQEVKKDFIDYCSMMERFSRTYKTGMNEKRKVEISPSNWVQCYRSMEKWKTEFGKTEKDIRDKAFESIIGTYVLSDSPKSIGLEDLKLGIRAMRVAGNIDAFDEIYKWIFSQMENKFGSNYANNDIKGRQLPAVTRRDIANLISLEITENLKTEGFIERFNFFSGFQSIVGSETEIKASRDVSDNIELKKIDAEYETGPFLDAS